MNAKATHGIFRRLDAFDSTTGSINTGVIAKLFQFPNYKRAGAFAHAEELMSCWQDPIQIGSIMNKKSSYFSSLMSKGARAE